MAKYIKKRKRRAKFLTKCSFIFSIALISLLFSSVVLGSINTNLTVEIQKTQNEIDNLKVENSQLSIDIQTLQNKDRVYTIANEAGMSQSQDNVVSVTGETSEAE